MPRKKTILCAVALSMAIFMVFQGVAQAFVFTAAFLTAATFLATNAGVIIPACAVIVALAGAGIAIVDVVDRIIGRNGPATGRSPSEYVMQSLSMGTQGIMRGVQGVSSMANRNYQTLSDGGYASTQAAYNDISTTVKQADTVSLAMGGYLADAKSTRVYADLTQEGLEMAAESGDRATSSLATAAGSIQREISDSAETSYQSVYTTRNSWSQGVADLKKASILLKNDADKGVTSISSKLSILLRNSLNSLGKLGEGLADRLAKVRETIEKAKVRIREKIAMFKGNLILTPADYRRVRAEQEKRLASVAGSGSKSGYREVKRTFKADDVEGRVETGSVSSNVATADSLQLFRDYRDAYRQYLHLVRTSPGSPETETAREKYLLLQKAVSPTETGGASNNTLAPAIEARMND